MTRAFLLGACAGLLAALSPACGTPKPCGPLTCAGCCRADGTCAAPPASDSDATCGQQGESCLDCSADAQACKNGACTGAGGGGGSGGCGPGTCNGCCTGTSVTSVCINPPTRNNCGSGGGLCQTCPAGQACEGGKCEALGDSGVLGRGCGVDGDCASLGSGALCKTQTASKSHLYLNGYCTRDCANSLDCGSNGVCVEQDPGFGEVGTFCWLRCESSADCRSPGYDCYPLGSGIKGCWLSPLPSYDAGPPSDKVGAPCQEDSQCQGPPPDGFCIRPVFGDGGASPYPLGYCSATCDESSHCSTDGGAGCFLVGSGGAQTAVCLKTCEAPYGGQSSCRAGYLCSGVRAFDGGVAPRGVCGPSCLSPGATCPGGTTCQATGYCQ